MNEKMYYDMLFTKYHIKLSGWKAVIWLSYHLLQLLILKQVTQN